MPLQYFRKFWRSLEIPLISCKVVLKLNSTKYSVLSLAGNENDINNNDNANNIIFTIFSSQVLLELIDYLFWFIQIMATILECLKLKDIIYQKG